MVRIYFFSEKGCVSFLFIGGQRQWLGWLEFRTQVLN